MKDALGLIEIKGLATAILVADTMVKTANVSIFEVEKTRGMGWITVKILGDVAAVTAAIQSGKQVGEQFQHFVSCKVIPRPSSGVEHTFCCPKSGAPKKPQEKEAPEAPTSSQQEKKPNAVSKHTESSKQPETEKKVKSTQSAKAEKPTQKSLSAASSATGKKEEIVAQNGKNASVQTDQKAKAEEHKEQIKSQNTASARVAAAPKAVQSASKDSVPPSLPTVEEQSQKPAADSKVPAAHKRSGKRKKVPEGKDSGSHLHGESGR